MWLKVKRHRRQEFVVCGYTPGRAGLKGSIGALLLGYFDGTDLVYAGRVGTGFDVSQRKRLAAALSEWTIEQSPFDHGDPFAGHQWSHGDRTDIIFVEPRFVCEVEFTEWTAGGTLRHPSFTGLREDKDIYEVVREEP
jgi:bifunctional non-homologous end joining protein LigD